MFKRTRHYLVSYAHENGFGNTFFEAKPHLNIRKAEEQIVQSEFLTKGVVILAVNRIHKKQTGEQS